MTRLLVFLAVLAGFILALVLFSYKSLPVSNEKFNIKRATYFTYLKICKEIDFIQIGGNKKYEDSEKINSVFKKQKDIIEQEKKKNNDNVQTKKNKVVDLEEMYGTSKLLNKLGEERKKAKI